MAKGDEVLDVNTRIIITNETTLTCVLNNLKFKLVFKVIKDVEDSSEDEDSEEEDYGVEDSEGDD